MKDVTGKELKVGSRVMVPGRVPGSPWELPPKGFDGYTTPRISGRIEKIESGAKGLIAYVRAFKNHGLHPVPLALCKRQYGLHSSEKDMTAAQKRKLRLR